MEMLAVGPWFFETESAHRAVLRQQVRIGGEKEFIIHTEYMHPDGPCFVDGDYIDNFEKALYIFTERMLGNLHGIPMSQIALDTWVAASKYYDKEKTK